MATANDTPAARTGPEFWRGLEEWTDTPEFRDMLRREFPDSVEEWTDPVSRRKFMTLMGASLALAGASGCISPRAAPNRKILPYTKLPERIVPGIPNYFATAVTLDGVATGVLVRSNEGRPTKIEGNPSHPGSLGGTDVYTQAEILNLYDPDRLQQVTYRGDSRSWDATFTALRGLLQAQREKKGAGLRIVTEPVTSPTLAGLLNDVLKEYPEAKWVQYEATGAPAKAGAVLAFGKPAAAVYDFTKADVVLALDADFLGCGAGSPRYARDFSSHRKVRVDAKDGVKPEQMSRLYAVETSLTPTGSVADHRLPLTPGQVESFARALAAELKVEGAPPAGALPAYAKSWLSPLAADLAKAGAKAVVVAGDTQPPAVHAVAHAINAKLGAAGQTVSYIQPVEEKPSDHAADLKALAEDLSAGKVELLFVLGVNPAFTAPADLKFAEALDKAKVRVFLGQSLDETAVRCDWVLPAAHALEAWGDARGYDGTATVQQPLIAPLYDGKSAVEVFAELLEKPSRDGLELVKAAWAAWFKDAKKEGDFELFWQKSLQTGVVDGTKRPAADVKLGDWAKGLPAAPADRGLEVAFRPDPSVFDGRFANNGWLQELPKPVTKIAWDNVVLVSPATAEKLGLPQTRARWTGGEHGNAGVPVVTLEVGGRSVTAPVWVAPGHADGCVTIHYGFGRTHAGRVGNGVGFNAYALRTGDAPHSAGNAKLTPTGGEYTIACTQMHYATENRKPVRPMTVAQYNKPDVRDEILAPPVASKEAKQIAALVPGPNESKFKGLWQVKENGHDHHGHDHDHDHGHDHGHEHHDPRLTPLTVYPPTNKTNRRWAMAIDTSLCFGCNACVAACVAENNIPVVGKDQVTRGREMHWIRIDRYHRVIDPEKGESKEINTQTLDKAWSGKDDQIDFVKDPAAVETYFQALLCQQCEKAPCELVCPVNATVHSGDGLNDMVYNRCVGTRYCSNNCPYKVRRFNFLFYADYATESLKLGRNPDVTVRTRGVMEKCTYCVQRIRAAEIEAEREWATRPKYKGPTTPEEAVTFDNANDNRTSLIGNRPKIHDGEVVTACQSACPAGAIMFGDIADVDSAVNRWKAEPTNYGLLAELNTMPRTTYLAAVRNPNPAMPKPKGV